MTITFEPTKKRGRFFYAIVGKTTVFRHPDGRAASPVESDAMAQGHIPGTTETARERIAGLETGSDTAGAIWRAFSQWAVTAEPHQYGALSPWDEYEITRN